MFRITIDLTEPLANSEFDKLSKFLETDCNIKHKYKKMEQDEIPDRASEVGVGCVVKPRVYTQDEADKRVEEVIDYMAVKYKKEFGKLIWTSLELTIFIAVSIIIGFITGYCAAPYIY